MILCPALRMKQAKRTAVERRRYTQDVEKKKYEKKRKERPKVS